ncbi:MAG: energy transducer TonB [Dysgonomonas sp.]
MRIKSYNILFQIFSYLSDRTNGAPFFVKYKLLLGTLIIGLTGNISAKAQSKEVIADTTHLKQPTLADPRPIKKQILLIVNVSTKASVNSNIISDNPLKYPEPDLLEAISGIMCYGIVVNPYHNDDIYTPRYREREFRYDQVSEKPVSPVGSVSEFQGWVKENVEDNEKMQGEVTVSFVINKKGKLVDGEIIKGISKEVDRRVQKALSKSKKWRPGKLYNKAVKTIIEITIKFDDE